MLLLSRSHGRAACTRCETCLPRGPQRHLGLRSLHVRTRAAASDDDDLVTRWVGKIFGKAAVEDRTPFGLKRMDWSQVKDLEVTMDKEAAPRASDDPIMKLLRPMLAGTQLEEEDLRLAYSAEEDGWIAQVFHGAVDGYGPALVLGRTQGGALLGGYNPLGFDGYGEKATMGSFLFTWPDGNTKGSKPSKLPKIETDQLAIVDRMDQGPQFGPGDLKILLQRASPKKVTSKLIDYKKPSPRAKSLFNTAKEPTSSTELVELKVYVRKGGKLKYTLDGLRWKSEFTNDGSGEGPPTGIFTL